MSRPWRSWRGLVATCALVGGVVLAVVTLLALRLERQQVRAEAQAARQGTLRIALWQLDSWLTPILVREAARPWFHYRPYVPHKRSYNRLLQAIEPGEVLSPSPLLSFRSRLLPLHFQIDADGEWSSPQVPSGNLLDLTQATVEDPEGIERLRGRLEELAAAVDVGALRAALGAGEGRLAALADEIEPEAPTPDERVAKDTSQARRGKLDLAQRWAAAQNAAPAPAPTEDPQPEGSLVPLWLGARDQPPLAYLRRVRAGERELLQGFLVDWPHLAERMLAEVADLLPGAQLVPERPGSGSDHTLATLPARLELAPLEFELPAWSGLRSTLVFAWAAAGLVLSALALSLRASVAFGERRARFASAVTHELRTPLTTFRMYTEMLEQGMVPEEHRGEYLSTLRVESDRLAGLVENVLSYARLEDGRVPLRSERTTPAALVERIRPSLERRLAEAGGALEVDLRGLDGRALETDPDAVGQILSNLVDNACKHGAPPVRLSAREAGERLELCVEDSGDGIDAARAQTIFRPFDRGAKAAEQGTPGIGLGLALARGLARDLGGELSLDAVAGSQPGGKGARFRLHLPWTR